MENHFETSFQFYFTLVLPDTIVCAAVVPIPECTPTLIGWNLSFPTRACGLGGWRKKRCPLATLAPTLFVGYRRHHRSQRLLGGPRRKRPRRSQQEGCGCTIGVRKELGSASSSYGRFVALCVRLPFRTHLSCWHLLYGHSGCAPAYARAHIVCRLPPALPRFGGSRRLAAPWSLRRCFVSSQRGLLARSSRPRFSSSLRTCFALRFAGPSSRAWAGSVWPAII